MTKSDRWILSEWLVARDRVLNFHEPLLHHRQKTPYAEVDLIFGAGPSSFSSIGREAVGSKIERPTVTVIEVKSVGADAPWAGEVLSRRQLLRLENARWLIELKARRPTRLLLATVEAKPGVPPLIRYFAAPF